MTKIKVLGISCAIGICTVLVGENIYNQYKNASILFETESLSNQESNNSGSGKFYYEHLEGRPKECLLYKHFKLDGSFTVNESSATMAGDVEVKQVKGIKETCPRKGSGCTVYSCTLTD